MRISDWSSDVCSSDLPEGPVPFDLHVLSLPPAFVLSQDQTLRLPGPPTDTEASNRRPATQRLLQACILQVVTTLECTQGSRRQTTAGRRPRIPSNPINNVKEQASPKGRSEEHTSELQSLMRISYAVFCLKKKKQTKT